MASANWMKCTTQKAGAMKKHLGQKEREQGNHSNKDINKELSKNNYAIGCGDYAEALEHMKRRTAEVDKLIPPKRIRKDRVTCCFIELPCPLTLTERGLSDDFFAKSYQTLTDFFGSENVHGGFVHKDEVHTYTDKNKKRKTSLEHVHVLVSAYTPEKGINGKAFETKARLKALNNELDDMCFRSFGVRLNTKEKPENKSVERLKEETELREEAERLREEANKAFSRLLDIHMEEEASKQRKEEAEQKLSELNKAYENDMNKLKAEYQEKLDQLKNEYSEEVFAKVGAIRAISEKLSHGEKKLTKQEQETVMSVAANVGQIEAEYTRLRNEAEERKATYDILVQKENAIIDQKAFKLAEDLEKHYESEANKAISQATKMQSEAQDKLFHIEQEKEKAVNEALKPYRRKINQLNQELEYTRNVCEFATKEPYTTTEKRYDKHMEQLAYERSRGGRSR